MVSIISGKVLTMQILILSATVNAQFYYPYYLGYSGNSNTYGGAGSSLSNRPSTYYNPYQNNNYLGTNSYGGSGGWNGITYGGYGGNNYGGYGGNNYGGYGGNNYGGYGNVGNVGSFGNIGGYYGYLGYGYNPWQNYWGYGDRKK